MNSGSLSHKLFSNNSAIFISIAILSIVTLIGLSLEMYSIALIPFAILTILFFLTNLKAGFYVTAICIPFSINMHITQLHITMNIPSEPLLMLLTIILIYRFTSSSTLKTFISHPLSILIFLYCLLLLISCYFSVKPLVSLRIAAQVLLYIVPSYFGILYISKEDPFLPLKLLLTSLFSFSVVSLISNIKHFSYGFSRASSMGISSPFYYDHTIYATMSAFMITLAFGLASWHLRKKHLTFYLYALTFITCFISMLSSYSRASMISICIAFVLYFIIRFKIRWYTITLGIVIMGSVLLFFSDSIFMKVKRNQADSKKVKTTVEEQFKSITNVSSDLSNLERLNRWNSAIRMIKEKPLSGFGYGMYQFEYFPYQKPNEMTFISVRNPKAKYVPGTGGSAHSEYLLTSSENGVLTGLVYIIILGTGIYLVAKNARKITPSNYSYYALLAVGMSLTTYIVHSFFNNFLDTAKICFIFYGLLAAIVRIDIYLRNKSVFTNN